ncbi:MFS-type transporter-like protein, partial [Dinothrombium tinctorium]
MKGLTPTQYGFVFGIYEFGIFILCPVYAKMIPHVSPKFLICMGLFVAGYCFSLFGILMWSSPGFNFLTLSIVLRIAASTGAAAFLTGNYSSIAIYFPDHVSQVFAITETCLGLGMILGPAIGGLLYEISIFCVPFIVMGSLTMLPIIFSIPIIPEISEENHEISANRGILSILSRPQVFLNVSVSFMSFLILGFNDTTLEPHLRDFTSLSSVQTGAVFLVSGVSYAIGNQIWGHFAEDAAMCSKIIVTGIFFTMIGLIFCGPMFPLPLKPNTFLVVVSQAVLEFGCAAQVVASFKSGILQAEKIFHTCDIQTCSIITSLFASAFSLGLTIGPVIGGVLVGNYGYQRAIIPLILIHLSM